MADAAPDDFTPDTHAAADTDFTPDKGTDLPGSVFDKPTITQRLSRIGKAVTPAAVGTALPIAAGYGLATVAGQPEEGGLLTSGLRIAGNTVGGALAPYAEWASQKLMGENPAAPSKGDVIKSTIMNGAFTALGEGGAAATKAAQGADVEQVRGALSSTPSSQRTVANVRKIRQGIRDQATSQAAETAKVSEQDLRNRDFWKQQGLNDQQIDSVMQSPDLQHQLASNIEAGNRYKQAYQTTLDHTRETFHDRYTAILGPEANVAVPTDQLGKSIMQIVKAGGEHGLSPSFKGFLTRKAGELTTAPKSVKWDELNPEVQTQLMKEQPDLVPSSAAKAGADTGNESADVHGSAGRGSNLPEIGSERRIARKSEFSGSSAPNLANAALQTPKALRTELDENLTVNATNLQMRKCPTPTQ